MADAAAGGVAPWRTPDAYTYLHEVERSTFAWEWLRRTAIYSRSWLVHAASPPNARERAAGEVGLASLIDPAIRGDEARPIWLAAQDRRVVAADAADEETVPAERFDVRAFRNYVEVEIDERGVEHWRFGDAVRSARIDLMSGTLLGAPTLLAFRLTGLRRLLPKLGTLVLLAHGLNASSEALGLRRDARRRVRWILELRVADALADGASQQEIARALFGGAVPASGWRQGDESHRSSVQRLVRAARARLANPVSTAWF